jgi:hypothetical protein
MDESHSRLAVESGVLRRCRAGGGPELAFEEKSPVVPWANVVKRRYAI